MIPVPEAFELSRHGDEIYVLASDTNGLAYGLEELAAQLQTGHVRPCRKQPQCPERGIVMFVQSADGNPGTFRSTGYWNRYFAMLSRSRFNTFNLVFGHQRRCFSPPYPYFVPVPDYPEIRVRNLSKLAQRRNLAALRRIGSLAQEWGIAFHVGIWQQYVDEGEASLVSGLNYEALFDYCPKGLAALLAECPEIRGIQFRMNRECGIQESDQTRFFHGMFKALAGNGRGLRVDLRAKGLGEETINAAKKLVPGFTVSTKFWGEHLGLPYCAAEINAEDRKKTSRYRRHGYWDVLKHSRSYDVRFQLWTMGSQRLLLWGDPAYGARFARCAMEHSENAGGVPSNDRRGFEVMSPLSHKGFGIPAGNSRRIFKDPADAFFRWEFERYWAFFLAFGLTGYDPAPEPAVFRAEFVSRFGASGEAAEAALRAASGVLPLVTAVHAPSASVFSYWPEMDSGGLSDYYASVPTGDPGRLQSVSSYVADILAGTASALISPLETAERLEQYAAEASCNLDKASASLPSACLEFVTFSADVRLLSALGRYHAARLRSAVSYRLFLATGDASAIHSAIQDFSAALLQWRMLSEVGRATYSPGLAFNGPPAQAGQWEDETPLLEEEYVRLKKIQKLWTGIRKRPSKQPFTPWLERTMEWRMNGSRLTRWPGPFRPAPPLAEQPYERTARRYAVKTPEAVVAEAALCHRNPPAQYPAGNAPSRTALTHVPPRSCIRNRSLSVACRIETPPSHSVCLHYRHLVQVEPWRKTPMRRRKDGWHAVTIPGRFIGDEWDFMYAFEVLQEDGTRQFFPDLFEEQPYFVVRALTETLFRHAYDSP